MSGQVFVILWIHAISVQFAGDGRIQKHRSLWRSHDADHRFNRVTLMSIQAAISGILGLRRSLHRRILSPWTITILTDFAIRVNPPTAGLIASFDKGLEKSLKALPALRTCC